MTVARGDAEEEKAKSRKYKQPDDDVVNANGYANDDVDVCQL